MPPVRIAARTSTDPLAVPRTVRTHDLTILSSMPAGRMTPIAAIPVLREDSARVRLRMALQMMETADMLINEVNVSVKAYLVPTLAFERFTSMDDLNRSWEGKPARDGLPITPFIERVVPNGVPPVLQYLGRHWKTGDSINTAYIEAYNEIWNFRAKNRSPDLALRTRLDGTLAPAFWHHSRFAHIVPDFDQATMDGNVELSMVKNRIAVRGLATHGPVIADGDSNIARNHDGGGIVSTGAGLRNLVARRTAPGGVPEVFAELLDGGLTVSLANIELAKKTQAFARLRERYTGHDDDYIIDMLMDGLSIPEQAWRQPMLLQERATIFGMAQRYATNGADLTKSVVNGATMIDLNFATPKCPCGGVIIVVAEALPGQLFERGADPYLHATKPDDFPHALRDMLDPEPVEAVKNKYIDTDHANGDGTFGYAPLNHAWNFAAPAIGGRFYRPKVDQSFSEDRQRIWAVEQKDPVLGQDFYVSRNIHTKPFVNPNQDPFEVTATGAASITGLTQFGPVLVEASNNYDEVMSEAPKERIKKPTN